MKRYQTNTTMKATISNVLNELKDWEIRCLDCLNDDFNTPMLIAELFNSSKIINDFDEKIGDR